MHMFAFQTRTPTLFLCNVKGCFFFFFGENQLNKGLYETSTTVFYFQKSNFDIFSIQKYGKKLNKLLDTI